jgi:hypothetical protein
MSAQNRFKRESFERKREGSRVNAQNRFKRQSRSAQRGE